MNASPNVVQYHQDVTDFLTLKLQDASNANVKGFLEYQYALSMVALRAAKGEPLMTTGDSFNAAAFQEGMQKAAADYGSQNLRIF